MMDEIYGLPSSNSGGYPAYYTHHEASHLPSKDGEEYETFVRSPWLSTSSGVSLSLAASPDDPANTCNSTQKSGSSSLQEVTSSAIRATISSHPLYPKLLEAYIDCQKVGAPLEVVNLLDKILQENDVSRNSTVSYCFGEDPELDEFMETYCGVLAKCKLDLARPYDEATTFLSNIASQLGNLCNNSATVLDEDGVSSDDDTSSGEAEVQQCNRRSEVSEIKDKLLGKYSGYISSLRHEFSKKKKKGKKLSTDARQILLDWWTIHYNWPYPTEADKVALAASTGLDQKQINNWFINQRKRHWKPYDNLKPIAVNNLYGSFFPE